LNEKEIEQLKRDLDEIVNTITEAVEGLKDYTTALILALKTGTSYTDSFEKLWQQGKIGKGKETATTAT